LRNCALKDNVLAVDAVTIDVGHALVEK
jgi:hypothetical protein